MTVAGTLVYLDPEFQQTGRLRFCSDMYSAGIVMLELLYGQRIQESEVKRIRQQSLDHIADPGLSRGDACLRLHCVSLACSQPSHELRPDALDSRSYLQGQCDHLLSVSVELGT